MSKRKKLNHAPPVVHRVSLMNEEVAALGSNLSHAGNCVFCIEWRKIAGRSNDTVIYATKGRARYCKCRNCGATWKRVI